MSNLWRNTTQAPILVTVDRKAVWVQPGKTVTALRCPAAGFTLAPLEIAPESLVEVLGAMGGVAAAVGAAAFGAPTGEVSGPPEEPPAPSGVGTPKAAKGGRPKKVKEVPAEAPAGGGASAEPPASDPPAEPV